MQTISIIVPCCNEAAALPLFYDEATRVLSSMPVDYELLFVDDGSRDGTLAEMRRLAAADAHVKYVSFSRNFGKEAAMYAGFCNARGDYAAVMDCDLQHPPALLPQMYELLQEGDCDSVAMRRQDRAGEPVVRSWFAHRFYRLINRIFLGPILMLTIAAGILLTDAIAGAEGRTLRCLLVAFCLLGLVSLGSEAKRGVADYHQAWQAAVQTIEAGTAGARPSRRHDRPAVPAEPLLRRLRPRPDRPAREEPCRPQPLHRRPFWPAHHPDRPRRRRAGAAALTERSSTHRLIDPSEVFS